MDFVSNYMHF